MLRIVRTSPSRAALPESRSIGQFHPGEWVLRQGNIALCYPPDVHEIKAEMLAHRTVSSHAARLAPRIGATVVAVHRVMFGAVLLLSALLNLWKLGDEGNANTYYAATVESMLMSWHNFFFVAFDPGGFLAADKPPLGLWVQVASAKLFGFNGVSLLLPEALAGVASVALLYYLVSRVFGRPAGLIAALALALTPVAVVVDRNNTMDSLLVLTLLLAACAVTRAAETGRFRLLLLGAVLVGLGFNIKELQAYLVVPALGLMYLLGAPLSWRARLWQLCTAGVTLLVVSFAWIVAVDLVPAGQRPYVTDSGTNSELSLALGYNGLGRITSAILARLPTLPFLHLKIDLSIVPAVAPEIGGPGVLRLFSPQVGGQISWLLPLALVGLGAAIWQGRRGFPLQGRQLGLVLWGVWLLTLAVFFSVARFYHLYYLIMLAPAVAALAGIGIVTLWQNFRASVANARSPWWSGWALPLAVLATALIQAHLLSSYSAWNGWLGPLVVALSFLAAAGLAVGRLRLQLLLAPDVLFRVDIRKALILAAVGITALLVAPAAWAEVSVAGGNGGAWLPQAGPSQSLGFTGFAGGRFSFSGRVGGFPAGGRPPRFLLGGRPGQRVGGQDPFARGRSGNGSRFRGGPGGFVGRGGFGGGAITFAGSQIPTLDPKLLSYLRGHRGNAKYLVATPTSSYASLFILDTKQPVLTLGGYQGWDRILTPSQLAGLVSRGTVRFFLLPGSSRSFGGAPAPFHRAATQHNGPAGGVPGVSHGISSVNDDLMKWVQTRCLSVPAGKYESTPNRSTGSRGGFLGGGRPEAGGPGQLYDCAAAGPHLHG